MESLIQFFDQFWGAFVVGIPTLIGVVYTARKNYVHNTRERVSQDADSLLERWMGYATQMEKRAASSEGKIQEHDKRLDDLAKENRSIRLTIIEIKAERDQSFQHNKAWWEWYDNGQHPPAPSRPEALVTKVENLYAASAEEDDDERAVDC